jgi:hypothetical protein
MNSTSLVPAAPAAAVPSDRDRRRENRRSLQVKATLTILDGAGAGTTHEVLTRDVSLSGVCFLLREPMALGQTCQLDLPTPGNPQSWVCEVMRVRELSNGKYEMGVQMRAKA